MATDRVTITVAGRQVSLSHPDKVMYPDTGFTKTDVVDYYTRVAPVLLEHLRLRPVTRIRYTGGTGGSSFFEKNAPSHTPDWIKTERVASPGSTKGRDYVNYIFVTDAATLAWLGNLAALELHTPQWCFHGPDAERQPDHLVADLDPGEGAGMAECAKVAMLLRSRFADDGLTAYPKSSGKKGLHIYCPISATQSHLLVSAYAKRVAGELSQAEPDLITAKMAKDLRGGKVFIDWSQNNAAKTTVAPYSLRNKLKPTVSTPMTWDEVADGHDGQFSPTQVFERLDTLGDLFAPVTEPGPAVPQE